MLHTSFARRGLRPLLLAVLVALVCSPTAGCEPPDDDDATGTDAQSDGASSDVGSAVDADSAAQDGEAKDAASGVDAIDTAAAPDTGETCNGEMGCPCSSSTDCNASLCVDTPDGKRCSKYCGDASCPTGWACAGDTGAGDPLSFCAIDGGVLCRPCTNDGACTASGYSGARCVNYGAAGSFCGLPCQSDAGCPSGRVCKDVKSIDGLSTKQCVVPGDGPGGFGTCTCSAADVASAASTTCKVEVGAGADVKTCAGSRSCGAGGLGPCVALQGAAAKCEQTQCLDPVTLTPLADGKPCDDGRVCTSGDTCQQGLCVSGKSMCPCEPGFQDCEASSGSVNLCIGPPICTKQPDGAQIPYQCKPNPGLTKVCDASLDTSCSKNACVPLSGGCTVTAVEATKEICDVPGATPDAEPGCRREVLPAGADPPAPTPCDDGLPCSKGDACSGGTCVPATITACQCAKDADCIDDGDLCNGTPFCDKSGTTWSCKTNPATVITCDTGSDTTCLVTACVPATGSCAKAPMPIGFPCSDGVACTSGDICAPNGTCASGSWVCCTTDGDCINPGSKFYADDGNLCNGVPYCNKQSGACELNPGSVVTCPSADDTACRHTLCDPKTGTCGVVLANAASKTACDDGDACTGSDTCLDGGVCGSSTFVCPCTTDVDCVAKDDGNLCNGTLYCDPNDNHCKPNPATVVNCQTVDDTPCTQTACQPKSGACKAVDLPEKTTCDADGSYCTSGDQCDGKGGCKAGTAICQCEKDADCAPHEDGNLCNGTLYCDKSDPKAPVCKLNAKTVVSCPSVDDTACNQNACEPKSGQCAKTDSKVGAPCDDGNPCTGGDGCDGKGVCSPGVGLPCACTEDAACGKFDDGDACNGAYLCKGKGCVYEAKPPSCDDGNSCTDDSCDKQKGCVHADNAEVCQDGEVCTQGDVCAGGVCVSGSFPGTKAQIGGAQWELGHAAVGQVGGSIVAVATTTSKSLPGNLSLQGTSDVWLAQIDGKGNTLWSQRAGGNGADDSGGAIAGSDATILIVGRTDSSDLDTAGSAGYDGYVAKVKVGGALLWQRRFGGNGLDALNAVSAAPNGNYAVGQTRSKDIAGATGATGTDDAWVVRLDSEGLPVWSKAFGGTGSDMARGITLASNGDAVIIGTAASPSLPGNAAAVGADAWLFRVGGDGSVIWSKTFGGTGSDSASAVANAANGGFLVGGYAASAPKQGGGFALGPPAGSLLVRVDGSGTLLWQRRVDPVGAGGISSLSPMVGGGFAAVRRIGETVELVRLDDNGMARWTRTFDAPGASGGSGIAPLPDGGLWFVDTTGASKPVGDTDVLVVRLDVFGHESCSVAGACAGKTLEDCGTTDLCTAGRCDPTSGCAKESGKAPCDDGNPCTADSCTPSKGCASVELTSACDDGDACTVSSTCGYGVCNPGDPVECSDGNDCTSDTCESATGCAHAPKPGSSCQDGTECTELDSCAQDVCTPGKPMDCDDGNDCTTDTCDAKAGCKHGNVADQTPCKTRGVCSLGTCHLWATLPSSNVISVANCALDRLGAAWCWGGNSAGLAGDIKAVNPVTGPTLRTGALSLTSLSMGYKSACGRKPDGKLACWGALDSLGVDPAPVTFGAIAQPLLSNIDDVQVGEGYGCALDSNFGVACWTSNVPAKKAASSVTLPGIAAKLAVGPYNTCILMKDGNTYCHATQKDPFSAWSLNANLPSAQAICRGGAFTCVVRADDPKKVVCDGTANDLWQLGDASIPTAGTSNLTFPDAVVKITCSNYRACVLDNKGAVWCWGDDRGMVTSSIATLKTATPTKQVRISGKVKQLSHGYEYISVLLDDGTLRSWGRPYLLGAGGTATAPEDTIVVPVIAPEPQL